MGLTFSKLRLTAFCLGLLRYELPLTTMRLYIPGDGMCHHCCIQLLSRIPDFLFFTIMIDRNRQSGCHCQPKVRSGDDPGCLAD
jgi:hypothetical protein